jgi:uncharacterized protein (TIGR00251 family)
VVGCIREDNQLLQVREENGSVYFKVRIIPRASREGVVGLYEDALKIRLTAAPVDGKANEACRAFLAKILSVSRAQVEIISGHTNRNKVIKVSGVNTEEILKALLP